jgi:GntR family transcriptional regulator, transcriptional repressor for pyruvate dehydrogenase complex
VKHNFSPIKPLRIPEEVARQIKESILLGHFGIGDRLPSEAELSEQFQVSRTAIRDALRVLKNAGFIIVRQGATGGAYVTNLTFERLVNAFVDLFMAEKISISEVFDVRLLVEPEVARRAAQNVTLQYAGRLRDNVDSPPGFHLALAEMCGNSFLECLARSMIDLTGRVVETIGSGYVHPTGSHRSILDAVLTGDSRKASELMREHTVESADAFQKAGKTTKRKGRPPVL